MCSDRLANGEAPACVQACPHQAISIRVVDCQQVIEDAEVADFLPAAPDPQITLPTTSYRTSRVFPKNMLPADYYQPRPQHPHWPLIVMLVLTQLSVGALLVGLLLDRHLEPVGQFRTTEHGVMPIAGQTASRAIATPRVVAGPPGNIAQSFRRIHATSALGFGLLALAASTLHLGRPQYAFRAFIGLRHSWLSREILAFAAFAAIACGFAALCWTGRYGYWSTALGWAVAASGVAGIFCSAMVYAVTGRPWWNFGRTAGKFLFTAAILGIASIWLTIVTFVALGMTPDARSLTGQIGRWLVPALVVTTAGKLTMEACVFRHLLGRRQSSLKRTAFLLAGPLSNSTLARFACGLLGGIVMPLFLLGELTTGTEFGPSLVISAILLLVACLAGELLERYQFFAACAAPRMPGPLS
jgi:DMSO reductase anchor subunit